MLARISVFCAADRTFRFILAVCRSAGMCLNRIVFTTDRTFVGMTVFIGVIRLAAPLMLHDLAVFRFARRTLCHLTALCRAAAVGNDRVVDSADLALVGVTGCILVIPCSTELMRSQLTVPFAAVFADCSVVAGCLSASML